MRICAHPRIHRSSQRGAAALIVVLLLFFVISMVAAYTSRNLIFEQRTATNQYRATQALEASEAGIEWALGQLNAGRITNSCTASTDDAAATSISFRERYLVIDGASGNITFRSVTPSSGGSVQPRCVFDGSAVSASGWGWTCSCPLPNASSGTISAPSGSGPAPAFIVQMRRPSGPLATRPDLLQLESNSCTRLNTSDCLNFNAVRGGTGDGVAAVRAVVALRAPLTRTPAGALTLGGSLANLPGGASLVVSNQDTAANGVTVHAAGTIPASGLMLIGLPGTAPRSTTATGDASLAPATQGTFSSEVRRFAGFFGMRPDTYMRQPGLPTLDCSSGCNATAINLALLRNPGRPLWLSGSAGTTTIDANVGSASAPALLIVEGDLSLSDGATLTGLVYGRKASWIWTVAGAATVHGAAIAEGSLELQGAGASTTINYDAAVLKTLRVGYGTFVRVPGSWRDF